MFRKLIMMVHAFSFYTSALCNNLTLDVRIAPSVQNH